MTRHIRWNRRIGFAVLFLGVALCFGPLDVHAQESVGVRAGLSANPDQFFIGAHLRTGPLTDRLWFQPNIEAGFGDNRTTVGFNLEFAYWIPLQNGWNAYFGGGPALNLNSFEARRGVGGRDTDVGPGLNLLLGLARPRGIFGEFKVGALDSPEVKFLVGWSF